MAVVTDVGHKEGQLGSREELREKEKKRKRKKEKKKKKKKKIKSKIN